MLSKYVKPGDKVEVQAVERVKFADEGEKKRFTPVWSVIFYRMTSWKL